MENVAEVKAPKKIRTVKTDLKKGSKILTIAEALDVADLNFIAQEDEIMGATSGGIIAPNHKMIYRPDTNKVLGVVGASYHPIQNSLAMSFMDSIVKKQGFHYSETISKDGGAVSIVTAQSDKNDVVGLGDEVCRQIKLVNGFNGNVGFGVEFSVLRLVCTNGMIANERESVIRFKHTLHVENRMETALQVFDKSIEFHDEFIRLSNVLAQTAVDKIMVAKFLDGLYSDTVSGNAKKDCVYDLFQHGKGNKGETAWDLYNGATEFIDHHTGKDEKRLDYSTFGAGVAVKNKAWDLAVALTA